MGPLSLKGISTVGTISTNHTLCNMIFQHIISTDILCGGNKTVLPARQTFKCYRLALGGVYNLHATSVQTQGLFGGLRGRINHHKLYVRKILTGTYGPYLSGLNEP